MGVRSLNNTLQSFLDTFLRSGTDASIPAGPFAVIGGTILTPGDGNKYHVFTSTGSLTLSGSGSISSAKILIIAGGGGGGGAYYGGGGGAGGVVYGSSIPLTSGTYPVTVGAGGVGGSPPTTQGATGSNSVFNTSITALGGGGGCGPGPSGGNPGGSGGGNSYYQSSAGGSAAPQPVPGSYTAYGNPGGGGPAGSGKGGGGAAQAGQSSGGSSGGGGGLGQAFAEFPGPAISSAIPAPIQPRWTPAVGPTGLFAGGGGGGAYYTYSGGSGGPGGGGAGGGLFPSGPVSGDPGVDFTGGGGGGTDYAAGAKSPLNNTYDGGKGGDGIVIIKYAIS